MLPTGKRRERVTFQQRVLDANGDPTGSWQAGFVRWAQALVRTRGEIILGQRVQGIQPLEVTALLDSQTAAITTDYRLLWRGAIYNIKAVAPTLDRAEISILAQADQTNG